MPEETPPEETLPEGTQPGASLPEAEPGPLPRPTLRLTGVFLAVLAIGLAIAWALNADNNADVAELGGPAPDFTVSLIGGGRFSLSDQLAADDTPIVLNLWASWCIPCRTETPEISAFAEEHPDVKVIGVAVEDTEDGAIEFAEEFMPSYQLGIGDTAFETAYPRLGLPVTYVIDESGIVTEWFNGIVTRQTLEDLVFN